MSDNFWIIKQWGVPTLASFPYTPTNDINWGSEAAWRNAPLHRSAELVFLTEEGDDAINAIKQLVAGDQPITFAISANSFSGHLSDNLISADEYNPLERLSHAQTVIGYDDSKMVAGHPDVGAFKIVNSWGSGWGAGGFYWISYDAFKKIIGVNGNELCYVMDISDYVPSLLAVWHYNNPPKRNVEHKLTIGNPPSYLATKVPFVYNDDRNSLPSFMICDITEFRPYYDSGSIKFSLEAIGGDASTISSFKIESYEGGYSPGSPTQVSAQSLQVPKTTPGRLENNFVRYSPVSPVQALDRTGIEVYQPGLTDWVGVDHSYIFGGSSMQAGDVGDSSSSVMQINVTGYSGVSFFWKVSSEQSNDYLRLYESSNKKMEISGSVGWTKVWYNFTGPGTHMLKWSFEKSSAISSLQDGAWIDHLQFIPMDDAFEQNDVSGQAAVLTVPNNYSNLILLDDDWYKVDLSVGDTFTATARFNGSAGNLDLYLYSTDAMTLLASSAHSSGDMESVSVVGALDSGYYYVKAVPADSGIANYSLELERSSGLPDFGITSSLSLSSGTGSFSALSESNSQIIAFVGQSLNGDISYDFTNAWTSDSVPLVLVFSWGDSSTSYRQISANLSAGAGSETATISDLVIPAEPGTYYLIFVFRNESNAAFVASATSTSHATPSWDDGNDIAGISGEQIADAQSLGRCTVSWLMSSSWQSVKVPADAIKVLVIPEEHTPPITQANCNGDVGSNGWYNSAVHIVLSPSDSGSGVNETKYRVDSSSWSSYDSPFLISSQGQHLVEYYSTDLAGNVESVKSVQLKIDSGNPVSSADLEGTKGSDDWYVTEVQIDITSSDGVSGVFTLIYNLDGSGEQTYDGGFIVSAEGSHVLTYYAMDVAGNVEGEHVSQFNVDTIRPTIAGELQGTEGLNGWFLSSVDIDIRGSDMASGIDSIMYQVDGGIWANYFSYVEVSQQGNHTISFYAVDHAGNRAETVNLTFRIDSAIPTALCNVAGDRGQNGWFIGDLTVNLTGQDDLSGIANLMYRLDGSEWTPYSGDIQIEIEGQHALDYFAIDLAGNNGTIESTILRLDSVGPVSVWLLNGTLGLEGWYVSSASISATGQDGNGSGIALFEYRLDGGSWENYSLAILIQGEGMHSMECRAIDVAGNVETNQVLDFMLDTVAPENSASINGNIGEHGWYSGTVEMAITADDVTSGVSQTYMRMKEGEWSLGNSGQFSDGVYLMEFYSTDTAGNSGPIQNVTIMSDLTAPLTTHLVTGTLSENGWFSSNVSLELDANDGVSGVDSTVYRLDGGDWIAYVGSIAFDTEGMSLIEYRSLDQAGNQEQLQSYEVKVDKAAPNSSVQINGESGVGGWYVSSLLIDINMSDNVSGIGSTDFRLDSGDWLPYDGQIAVGSCGAHLLQFHSKDIAGNVEPDKQVGFNIDNDKPTVLAQIDGRVFTANQISFNWTSNDSTSGVGAIELSLDGAAYQMLGGTQSNFTLQRIGDGQHSLLIRVTDLAGNKVIKELSFVVDTNPLSPQGPFGPALLIALLGIAALIVALLIRRARRR
jgi:hypothetical protein